MHFVRRNRKSMEDVIICASHLRLCLRFTCLILILTSSQFSPSLCNNHSWGCLPQLGMKCRGEGILRMEDTVISEKEDANNLDFKNRTLLPSVFYVTCDVQFLFYNCDSMGQEIRWWVQNFLLYPSRFNAIFTIEMMLILIFIFKLHSLLV